MAKSELYIHIGMPKTATSALQRFFTINRDVLKEKGIAYPAIGNMEAHHRLGWSLKAERGLSHWWFDKDIDSYAQEWQELSRQCCLPRNLISTETLWGIDDDGVFQQSRFYIVTKLQLRNVRRSQAGAWERGEKTPGKGGHPIRVKLRQQKSMCILQ